MLERLGIIVSRFIPSGVVVPIVRGPLRGARWIVGSAAGPAKGLSIALNMAEPERLARARELVSTDSVCFDIGANVGFLTLLFARYSKCVFAFEPLPRNIRYLSRTLELNGVENATIVPWAMSDSTRLSSFEEGVSWSEGRLSEAGRQPVSTVSCDEFVSTYQVVPSLLKIDVEGAELGVLRGAENLLLNHRPALLLETHGEALRASCLELLRNLGYGQVIPLDKPDISRACDFAILP